MKHRLYNGLFITSRSDNVQSRKKHSQFIIFTFSATVHHQSNHTPVLSMFISRDRAHQPTTQIRSFLFSSIRSIPSDPETDNHVRLVYYVPARNPSPLDLVQNRRITRQKCPARSPSYGFFGLFCEAALGGFSRHVTATPTLRSRGHMVPGGGTVKQRSGHGKTKTAER